MPHAEPLQNQIADQIWELAEKLGPGDRSTQLKELADQIRWQLVGDDHPQAVSLFRCPQCHSVSMSPPEALGGDGDLCSHPGGPVRRQVVAYAPYKVLRT